MKDLALPLTGGNNRCIRDALGRVVSVPEHAEAFAHTMNWHRHMIDGLGGTIEHLRVLRAKCQPGTIAYGNADTATRAVEKLLAQVQIEKLPPAPTEATEDHLVTIMATDQWSKKYPDGVTWASAWEEAKKDVDHEAHHFQRKARISAQAILVKFKVYPR